MEVWKKIALEDSRGDGGAIDGLVEATLEANGVVGVAVREEVRAAMWGGELETIDEEGGTRDALDVATLGRHDLV